LSVLTNHFFPNQSPEADTIGGDWLVALADWHWNCRTRYLCL
jgi:hypothetical protein